MPERLGSQELHRLVAGGETLVVERKRELRLDDNRSRASFAVNVMALANVVAPDEPYRYLVLGVDNDGSPQGLEPETVTPAVIRDALSHYCDPTPVPIYNEYAFDGKRVGVISIEDSRRKPHRLSKGVAMSGAKDRWRKGTVFTRDVRDGEPHRRVASDDEIALMDRDARALQARDRRLNGWSCEELELPEEPIPGPLLPIPEPLYSVEQAQRHFYRLQKVREFESRLEQAHFAESFLLVGARGSGKTSLLTHLAGLALRRGHRVVRVERVTDRALRSLSDLLASLRRPIPEARWIFILDDLGSSIDPKCSFIHQVHHPQSTDLAKISIWAACDTDLEDAVRRSMPEGIGLPIERVLGQTGTDPIELAPVLVSWARQLGEESTSSLSEDLFGQVVATIAVQPSMVFGDLVRLLRDLGDPETREVAFEHFAEGADASWKYLYQRLRPAEQFVLQVLAWFGPMRRQFLTELIERGPYPDGPDPVDTLLKRSVLFAARRSRWAADRNRTSRSWIGNLDDDSVALCPWPS